MRVKRKGLGVGGREEVWGEVGGGRGEGDVGFLSGSDPGG